MKHFTRIYRYGDDYHFRGGWIEIRFGRHYADTYTMPYRWNNLAKKQALVAQFVRAQTRGLPTADGRRYFVCTLFYSFSSN